MKLLNGKVVSASILEAIKKEVEGLEKKPCLAVILANNDNASKVYVGSKEKTSMSIGFKSSVYRFDKTVTQGQIISLIHDLNNDPDVNGILVQLPLYSHLNEEKIIEIIDPKKDVDGFHPINVGRLNCGIKPYSICCTPKGIIKLLKAYKIGLSGKSALVIGRSNIVGKPLATLLTLENATVTLAHSKTKDLMSFTRKADIIISATGHPKLINSNMIKKGAIVIDVGITRQMDGKLIGDVDFENVKDIAGYITPVPGGVGPMTIASLMENTLELYKLQNQKEN